jgi:hypothetical protein
VLYSLCRLRDIPIYQADDIKTILHVELSTVVPQITLQNETNTARYVELIFGLSYDDQYIVSFLV